MALTNCKECGKEVSATAKKCPHCGHDFQNEKKKNIQAGCIGIFIILMIIGGIASFFGSDNEKKTAEKEVKDNEKDTEIMDPMGLSRDSVESVLLGKNFYDLVAEEKIPEAWGKDEKLELDGIGGRIPSVDGTVQNHSHEFIGFYYEKSNVSYVVNNLREDVIYAGFSKDSAKAIVRDKVREKMAIVKLISDRLKEGGMHDPKSFEHVETQYKEWEGNEVVLKMTYRGKNAYGTEVQNWLKVRVNLETSNVEVLEQG